MGAVIMVKVAAVFSMLGNPNSLVPLAAKDILSTAAVTSASYMTGKEEGQDRLIDDVGTQIIWLLGISVIGFILVIVILFLKAFVLGFSVGSIIATYKLKGVLIAFIYSFPHLIINILVFILIGAFALIMSFKIINSITSKKSLDFKHYMNRYLTVLVLSIIILTITSFYDIYAVPHILNFVITIIKW